MAEQLSEFILDGRDFNFNQLAEMLEKNGFVVIKNFLDVNQLKLIQEDIERLAYSIADSCKVNIERSPLNEVDRLLVSLLKERPEIQGIVYDRLQMLPTVLALPNSHNVMDLAKKLHDTERLGVWPRVQIRMDLKNDEYNKIGWHSDYMYNKGTKESYTFWIALVDMNKEMGIPEIAKGSHKITDINFVEDSSERRFEYTLPDDVISSFNIFATESLNAGDLILFHDLALHTGKMNKDDTRARLTAIFRMQNLNKLEDLNKNP